MLFPTSVQPVVDASANVRVRDVDVISVYIDMQPIPFNRGYYSIDLTFFFDVSLELYGGATVGCERVSGISIFNKKVILYGSEGNVKMFTSESCRDEADLQGNKVLPKATVQVAQPVALSAKLCEHCRCGCERGTLSGVPAGILEAFNEPILFDESAIRRVCVSLGQFSTVRLERDTQLLIPVYDYCIPSNECTLAGGDCSCEDPCRVFDAVEFPMDDFFPPAVPSGGCCNCACPCGEK